MMKFILSLFCLSLTSYSIRAQQSTSYEIIGNVKNIPATQVYIRTLKRAANNKITWPIINSAKVMDGKFKLFQDTLLLDPSWATSICYIDSVTKKEQSIMFINKYHANNRSGSILLENTKMKVEGDIKGEVYLTGSPETDMSARYGLLFPDLDKINNEIDSLKKIGDPVKLSKVISLKNDSLIAFKNKLFDLATENTSSWMTLLNVYQNADRFTPAELARISKIFTKEIMATPKGKSLSLFQQQSGILVSGASFPVFNYKDVNQKIFSLNDVKGKIGTLVIFWASWCGPCRAEIPALKKIYDEYKSKGINLVSISTDHDVIAWKKALAFENMPWTNLSNLPGDNNAINKIYNLNAIPAVFLLDAQNLIVMPNEYLITEIRESLIKFTAKK